MVSVIGRNETDEAGLHIIEAKKRNRSLNNLGEGQVLESVLLAFVSEKPNKITFTAMKEAETSDNLETLDLSNFCNFVDSL